MKALTTLCLLTLFFCSSCKPSQEITAYSNPLRLHGDMYNITKTDKSRNHKNVQTLNEVAGYIYKELKPNCDTVYYQTYTANGREYKNVVGSIGPRDAARIIVGAHYDVAGEQEGADDNATGVTGLLELSRLLKKDTLNYRLDFVAYTLEEPPYFRTEKMGSFIHATSLYNNEVDVKGMICLEMIGYFDNARGSQKYPVGFLKWFYGNKGDYITVVQKYGNGKFGRRVKRLMKKQGLIKTKSFTGPASLAGIDFSDHLNYWKYDYSAVMITNTSFYRNHNYHKPSDTMETLDIDRMAMVIDEVYLTLLSLD